MMSDHVENIFRTIKRSAQYKMEIGQTDNLYSSLPPVVDDLLSKELLKLSLRDRNAIGEEVHGVLTLAAHETPLFLEESLLRLSEELDRIPSNNPSKKVYLQSQKISSTYVNGNDFRLRFLRADFFDAKKAAYRMITFLDAAFELFGPSILDRPIKISNFPKEEQRWLRVGNVQVLPFRDRSGRPICAWVGDFAMKLGTPAFRARLMLYIYFALSDDIESQQKGIVSLNWIGNNQFGAPASLESMRIFPKINNGSPLRFCSFHFCMPDKQIFHVLRSMYALTHFSNNSRMKFHVGDEADLLYTLKGFGIPVDLIPVTGTGNIKVVYWKQWIRLRKLIEKLREEGVQTPIIEFPGSKDIIFRTGTALTCHPGNVMFQSVIESKMKEHSTASQIEKIAITRDIIEFLRQRNGRFLQWDTSGYWTELKDPSLIYGKVANSVRDFKRKTIAKQNQQNAQSSTFIFQNQDGQRRNADCDFDCFRNI